MIYENILKKYHAGEKQLAYLIDPDKTKITDLNTISQLIREVTPDLILVGGSLVSCNIKAFIHKLKEKITTPVILFPGSILQFSDSADGLLFLSLLSGRNPELLIGQHVAAAPLIKQSGMEVMATGYILIESGRTTSVGYMSNTLPIPSNKSDIVAATAIAGEMLGMKLIYLEAGSGALEPVPTSVITDVKAQLNIPLIVGGGLNTASKVEAACQAGADIIVVGNALEKDPSLLKEFHTIVKSF
ncbi:geranylgeranylglyceryl/heptaprenylglyceryl phosphate synthase [Marinilabiliaceae bacterium JC017]|nr:geranylgeranylglyceryl/heptaprenylglyceryl phosphate synthase [Marinilabiliaceae bacterium JC017]